VLTKISLDNVDRGYPFVTILRQGNLELAVL